MPNHPQCRTSRSGKNKTAKTSNLQLKLPVSATLNSPFEISGHAFVELPSARKHGKTNEPFKLPVLNPIVSSKTPAFFRPTEIRSPILTFRTEWKVPANNESIKSDSISQPSFIRSVSASESESWSDDLESEMTAQLMASITQIDDMFYSSFPVTSNRELFQEIKLWQSRFPFFRFQFLQKVFNTPALIHHCLYILKNDSASYLNQVRTSEYARSTLFLPAQIFKIFTRIRVWPDNLLAASDKRTYRLSGPYAIQYDSGPSHSALLWICGKKAKIVSNNRTSPEAVLEKEEVIFNDKFNDDDDDHSVKPTFETAESKNSLVLKQQIRNAVINHLTNHFVSAMKNEFDQNMKRDDKAVSKKSTKITNRITFEAVDINDNRLKVNEDLGDLLNISPISLKVAAPKSNYLSSFVSKKSENIKSKTTVKPSTHLRIEHKLSTKIVHTVLQSSGSTVDNMSCSIVLHQNKSSLSSRKPFESSLRENNKVRLKSNDLIISNPPRFGTLPPLKTHGLRPTSAVYSSYNKLPSESRPTSSFILASCLLKSDSSRTDES